MGEKAGEYEDAHSVPWDHDDDDDEDNIKRQRIDQFKAVIKLLFIIICYAAAFISLVQLGFWLVKVPVFDHFIILTDVKTWLEEKWTYGIWWDMVTRALVRNSFLLIVFVGQHSLLSKRFLDRTWWWMKLHYEYKVDRPLYVLTTAIVLQVIIRGWQPVPVVLWSLPWIQGWFKIVHILAWISLYGTSLMLDLPDMVGFNQVVVSSPTVTQKSPELQMMYRAQRHMGLLPFLFMLLAYPNMTLDRILLTVGTVFYTYGCWRSTGCYAYASRMKEMKIRRL